MIILLICNAHMHLCNCLLHCVYVTLRTYVHTYIYNAAAAAAAAAAVVVVVVIVVRGEV